MQRGNVALAILVILVIAFASLAALEYTMLGNQKTATSTIEVIATVTQTQQGTFTQLQQGTATWIVLKNNVTIYYGPACAVISATNDNSGCPTENNATRPPSPSISNVELVSYQGTEYYVANENSVTVWLTNSTVFCVSPTFNYGPNPGYPACP